MTRLTTSVLMGLLLGVFQLVRGQNTTSDSLNDSPLYLRVSHGTSKQLIKAGISLPLLRQTSVARSVYWKDLSLTVALEQKLTNHLVLAAGLEQHYLFGGGAQLSSLELPIGLRYYFSLGQTMKKQSERSTFYRYYLALQTYNVLFADMLYAVPNLGAQTYYRGQRRDFLVSGGHYQETFTLLQAAYFQVGRQIKLPKSRYLDANIIIPVSALAYGRNEWTLAAPAFINLTYGLTWQR